MRYESVPVRQGAISPALRHIRDVLLLLRIFADSVRHYAREAVNIEGQTS